MAIRAFQYRLYPTQAQEQGLQVQLDVSRHVYHSIIVEFGKGMSSHRADQATLRQ